MSNVSNVNFLSLGGWHDADGISRLKHEFSADKKCKENIYNYIEHITLCNTLSCIPVVNIFEGFVDIIFALSHGFDAQEEESKNFYRWVGLQGLISLLGCGIGSFLWNLAAQIARPDLSPGAPPSNEFHYPSAQPPSYATATNQTSKLEPVYPSHNQH